MKKNISFKGHSRKYRRNTTVADITCLSLGIIRNWFDGIFDKVNKLLCEENCDEVVICRGGNEFAESIITFAHPYDCIFSQEYINDAIILAKLKSGNVIKPVYIIKAEFVQNVETDFDRDLDREGIIRLTK